MESKLTEKELKFVTYLAKNSGNSQRRISATLGYSLGLTNIILKRLIKTGYIKTQALNRRKVEYILTPKGFLEKTKKSYNYFLKTIDSVRSIKDAIQNIILEEYIKGEKNFIIVGNNELSDITEIAVRGMRKKDIIFKRIYKKTNSSHDWFYLFTENNVSEDMDEKKSMNILKILSNLFE